MDNVAPVFAYMFYTDVASISGIKCSMQLYKVEAVWRFRSKRNVQDTLEVCGVLWDGIRGSNLRYEVLCSIAYTVEITAI
jgi:hypothetical protein